MIITLGARVLQVSPSRLGAMELGTNMPLQIIFSAVVLALSVVLVKQYGPGHAPSLFDYGAFCGAASLAIAGVGIVACFYESLQGVIMLALDGLTVLFLLAGGIVSCGHPCREFLR